MEGASPHRSGGYNERARIRIANPGLQLRTRRGPGIDRSNRFCYLSPSTWSDGGGGRGGLGVARQGDHEKTQRTGGD